MRVAGIDLVRDGAGRWAVLEDNLRVPSGIGYAIANRWLVARILPELVLASLGLTPPPRMAVQALRFALTRPRPPPPSSPQARRTPAFYEHRLLAHEMEIPLAQPGEMHVADDGVWIDGAEPARVEVLYRRIDEDELFGARGADGKLLGPGLLDAIRNGALVLANAPGNGVADDKSLYAYVPKLIEYYLGERPLLDNVPTYLCRDAE